MKMGVYKGCRKVRRWSEWSGWVESRSRKKEVQDYSMRRISYVSSLVDVEGRPWRRENVMEGRGLTVGLGSGLGSGGRSSSTTVARTARS